MQSGFYLCKECDVIVVLPAKNYVIPCSSCLSPILPVDHATEEDLEKLSSKQILLLMSECFLISTDMDYKLTERYLIWEAGTTIFEIVEWLEDRFAVKLQVQSNLPNMKEAIIDATKCVDETCAKSVE